MYKLLVLCAHADDCEKAGGIALKFMKAGGKVKFLTATNGCSGHQEKMGGTLVQKRFAEARRVAEQFGVEYDFLDFNDGFLTAGLPERAAVIKTIREYKPTVIFTHRNNDYHPDHRNTALLVQDSSYLVQVPNICPMTPVLEYQPAIFYLPDEFQKPAPFSPDLVFDISDVFEEKMRMYHQYDSQMYEWLPWVGGELAAVPADDAARFEWLKEGYFAMSKKWAADWQDLLVKKYNKKGSDITAAEALEKCEYGGQLTDAQIADIFPF